MLIDFFFVLRHTKRTYVIRSGTERNQILDLNRIKYLFVVDSSAPSAIKFILSARW